MKIENPTAPLIMLALAFVAPTLGGWEPGDMNCDDLVNSFDLDGFVLAILYPEDYYATYPDCDRMNADLNGDQRVDFFDLDWIIDPLIGQGGETMAGDEPLRLFFSTAGLSNPEDPTSPAESPLWDTGHNATVSTHAGTRRLYLWAQMQLNLPYYQNWSGISFDLVVTGSATITDWLMWNAEYVVDRVYFTRWHDDPGPDGIRFGELGAGNQVLVGNALMALVFTGANVGVTDDPVIVAHEGQYDPDTTATLLGWFEFSGVGDVYLGVGELGIKRQWEAPALVYFGWGDEADGLLGNSFGQSSSLADAHLIAGTLGDMNCDGSLNGFDIDPFVMALVSPGTYHSTFPDCDILLGDVNGDGLVNGFDIDGFVSLLVQ